MPAADHGGQGSPCPLCEAEVITRRYHEDEVCWVADCSTCGMPMVVWKYHGTLPPEEQAQHMLAALQQVAEGLEDVPGGNFLVPALPGEHGARFVIDTVRRSIPDHWHAHARLMFEPDGWQGWSAEDWAARIDTLLAPNSTVHHGADSPAIAWRVVYAADGRLRAPFTGALVEREQVGTTETPHPHASGVHACARPDDLVAVFPPFKREEGLVLCQVGLHGLVTTYFEGLVECLIAQRSTILQAWALRPTAEEVAGYCERIGVPLRPVAGPLAKAVRA